MVQTVTVDAHDGVLTGVDLGLLAGGSLLNSHLGDSSLDGLGHAAKLLHLLDVRPGLVCDFVGQALNVVGAGPWVDHPADVGLFLQVNLCVTRDAGRKVGRQCDGLVKGVGVQRLGVTQCGAHSLDAGAGDVVEGILLGQRPAGGLAVRAQRQRFRILRLELVDDFCPEQPRRTHLGNLHEVVHANSPEEGEPRGEGVDAHACIHACAEIFQTVRKGVGQLNVRSGTGLLHVVAGNAYGVELGHIL